MDWVTRCIHSAYDGCDWRGTRLWCVDIWYNENEARWVCRSAMWMGYISTLTSVSLNFPFQIALRQTLAKLNSVAKSGINLTVHYRERVSCRVVVHVCAECDTFSVSFDWRICHPKPLQNNVMNWAFVGNWFLFFWSKNAPPPVPVPKKFERPFFFN